MGNGGFVTQRTTILTVWLLKTNFTGQRRCCMNERCASNFFKWWMGNSIFFTGSRIGLSARSLWRHDENF